MDCFEPLYRLISPLEKVNNTNTIAETVNIHNRLRAQHGSAKLTVNSELNDIAQSHANYLGISFI